MLTAADHDREMSGIFKLLGIVQVSDINTLPFSREDITLGPENEMQVAVQGNRDTVDLPAIIASSKYYRNIVRRTKNGEYPHKVVSALENFLCENRDNIWENSWVRIREDSLHPICFGIPACRFPGRRQYFRLPVPESHRPSCAILPYRFPPPGKLRRPPESIRRGVAPLESSYPSSSPAPLAHRLSLYRQKHGDGLNSQFSCLPSSGLKVPDHETSILEIPAHNPVHMSFALFLSRLGHGRMPYLYRIGRRLNPDLQLEDDIFG